MADINYVWYRKRKLTSSVIGATSGGGVVPGATGIATSTGALVVPGIICAGCCHVEEGARDVAEGSWVGMAGGGKGTLGATMGAAVVSGGAVGAVTG